MYTKGPCSNNEGLPTKITKRFKEKNSLESEVGRRKDRAGCFTLIVSLL